MFDFFCRNFVVSILRRKKWPTRKMSGIKMSIRHFFPYQNGVFSSEEFFCWFPYTNLFIFQIMSLAPGLQWGTWDKDSDMISFPSFQNLQSALKEITRWLDISRALQLCLTFIPVTEEHPGDPPYFIVDKRSVSSLSFTTVFPNGVISRQVQVAAKDHTFNEDNLFIATIEEHSDGSVVFPNKLKYFSDVLLYTDIVQRVYPWAYPALKIDLQVLLMGTLDRDRNTRDNPVFRFFKHTLCECRVLDLVKKF